MALVISGTEIQVTGAETLANLKTFLGANPLAGSVMGNVITCLYDLAIKAGATYTSANNTIYRFPDVGRLEIDSGGVGDFVKDNALMYDGTPMGNGAIRGKIIGERLRFTFATSDGRNDFGHAETHYQLKDSVFITAHTNTTHLHMEGTLDVQGTFTVLNEKGSGYFNIQFDSFSDGSEKLYKGLDLSSASKAGTNTSIFAPRIFAGRVVMEDFVLTGDSYSAFRRGASLLASAEVHLHNPTFLGAVNNLQGIRKTSDDVSYVTELMSFNPQTPFADGNWKVDIRKIDGTLLIADSVANAVDYTTPKGEAQKVFWVETRKTNTLAGVFNRYQFDIGMCAYGKKLIHLNDIDLHNPLTYNSPVEIDANTTEANPATVALYTDQANTLKAYDFSSYTLFTNYAGESALYVDRLGETLLLGSKNLTVSAGGSFSQSATDITLKGASFDGDINTTGVVTLDAIAEGRTIANASEVSFVNYPTTLTADNTIIDVAGTVNITGWTFDNGASLKLTADATVVTGGKTVTIDANGFALTIDDSVSVSFSGFPTGASAGSLAVIEELDAGGLPLTTPVFIDFTPDVNTGAGTVGLKGATKYRYTADALGYYRATTVTFDTSITTTITVNIEQVLDAQNNPAYGNGDQAQMDLVTMTPVPLEVLAEYNAGINGGIIGYYSILDKSEQVLTSHGAIKAGYRQPRYATSSKEIIFPSDTTMRISDKAGNTGRPELDAVIRKADSQTPFTILVDTWKAKGLNFPTTIVTADISDVPTALDIADAVWDEVIDNANHNEARSAGKRLRQAGTLLSANGAVNDVSATPTEFVTNLTQAQSSFYADQLLVFTGGALEGQASVISSYDGATKKIVLAEPLVVAPSNADEFDIIASHIHPVAQIQQGLALEATAQAIASDMTTNQSALIAEHDATQVAIAGVSVPDISAQLNAQTADIKGADNKDLSQVFSNVPQVDLSPLETKVQADARQSIVVSKLDANKAVSDAIKLKTDLLSFVSNVLQTEAVNMRGTDGAITDLSAITTAINALTDATPQEIWEYATRTLSVASGLTESQEATLNDIYEANFNNQLYDKNNKILTLFEADGTTPKQTWSKADTATELRITKQ